MDVKSVDHIGIAVKDVLKAKTFYVDVLGCAFDEIEILEEMKLKVLVIRTANLKIELLEPLDGEQTITRFLDTRGEGIHHICFHVDDIEGSQEHLRLAGCRLVWDQDRLGAGGKRVQFIHPSDACGVLTEISASD